MGWGDDLMATGDAKLAFERTGGLKVALGTGKRLGRWSPIFDGNPKIATQRDLDNGVPVVWVKNYKGHRPYHNVKEMQRRGLHISKERWLYNMDYRAEPGEIFFLDRDLMTLIVEKPFIVIEASVKKNAFNKQWPVERYQSVVNTFKDRSFVQFNNCLEGSNISTFQSRNFKQACYILNLASAYVGPEGGLHHAAAALGVPGVIIFGGFTPPSITGYSVHVNLYSDIPGSPCGNRRPCNHCTEAMANIQVDDVCLNLIEVLEKSNGSLGQISTA